MKNPFKSFSPNRPAVWMVLLLGSIGWFDARQAHAGLSMEMNVIRYDQYGYAFYPNMTTNTSGATVPFGDYYVTSFSHPTNGAWQSYRFDTNGFNFTGGGNYGYGDFDGMRHELTNGTWSISVTNAASTNIYHFTVRVNISSNDLPLVAITSPTNGAVNVTSQPTYTWQGPTNYSDLVLYYYNNSPYLPVTQTSQLSSVLYQGLNSVTAHYDSNSTTAVISSVPTNSAAQPISSWVSTDHLQDYASSTFTVGMADPSGTSHALVAHYTWDNTNNDGTASGADSSGNGYNMNFGGGYGSHGGVDSTTTTAAGPRAIQFHNGDGNSAGFAGWNPTPTNLLNALAGSFTVSCWIKTTQTGAGGWDQAPAYYGAGIVSADNSGLANDVIPLALTGSKIGFNTGGTVEDVTLNSQASVNDGNYHHVVVTRNQQTGQKIIYIDGALDSFSSGTTNLLNSPRLLTIGALADASQSDASSANYYNGYDGEVDDLQIYTGVLSSNEVATLFAAPGTTIANGGGPSGGHQNIAHYAFEDGTSTFQLGLDSSPLANTFYTYSYWGQVHTNTTDAKAGTNAVQFFGTSSIVAVGQPLTNLNAVLAGSFSFSAWVKTTASRGNDYDNAYYGATIFWAYNDHNNTNDTIPLAITGSKAAFTTRGSNPGAFDNLHSTTSVNDGNYHLITVTREQSTGEKKMYVDGNFEASEIGTSNPLNGNDYYLSIGGTTSSSYTGILDDVQVYAGVLSSSDVAYLYANPGAVVADVSGNDFPAALNTTKLTWATGGDLPWFTETATTLDGLAAQSGPITDSQSSYLETTVPAGGQLSFNWKVSSESGYDFLTFYINGNQLDAISGEVDWNQQTYAVSAGDVLRWEYSKDSSGSGGQDAGYLDEVSYVTTPPNTNSTPVITLNPFSQTNYPGYNVALLAAATSNPAATWQWFKVGSGLVPNATNALYIPTYSGTVGVAGSYYAVASNIVGSATSSTAVVSFASAPLPPDWNIAFKTQVYNNASDATTNYILACLLDPTGTNIYTVGSTIGANFFGANTLISPNGASGSAFLKQTTNGTAVWGVCMTNNGNGSSYGECMAAAPGGGIYAAGDFFGTNWLGTNKLVDVAGGSTYVARFDANGNVLWIQTITGTNGNFTEYHDLTSDPAGNVTLSALISGGTRIGTSNVFVLGQRGVLAQFDSNGNLRWVQMPSGWPEYLVYNNGCIYGSMGGATTNYIGGVTNVSDRHQALFSINANTGQGNWVRGMAAQINSGNPFGFVDDSALVAVSGTNVFVAGIAWGSNAMFGAYTLTFPVSKGLYFARYDTNGNAQLATTFGSVYTWPWSIQANASGNVYIGSDFDTYSIFGNDIIAAPFYESVQSLGSFAPGAYIPGQTCVAKFDRNGNPLWARLAESESSYLNSRDITLASDGVWSCGLFNQQSVFGSFTINGALTCIGTPFCTPQYHPSGYLAKITDSAVTALPVTLLNPQDNGVNFQFQFLSQSGFNHTVLYRTNLISGLNWQTNSTIAGDGTVKTISIPRAVFSPANQGFIRILTQ